jgi:hypothetical protein
MIRIDVDQLAQMRDELMADPGFGQFLRHLSDVPPETVWRIFEGALRAADSYSNRLTIKSIGDCRVEVGGHVYWRNPEGALVPAEAVRPADQLEDETVRKIIGFAKPLSAEISRFWRHTREDIAGFVDLVLQQYAASRGGKKGNITLTSFDDMFKVELQVSRLIEFGADLQAAKVLTDECLAGWSEGSGAEIRTIVRTAFNVDKDGRVNQQALLGLLRHDFSDERWQRAMEAIRNAIKVKATKEYLRFWERPDPGAAWVAIPIDLARA